MTKSLQMNCWMDFPDEKSNRIVQGILKRLNQNYSERTAQPETKIYWEEATFDLQNVRLFQNAPLEKQKEILKACSRMLLSEAFAIERSGMAFAAKMVLLSNDLDSRLLYSQFGAQEAAHYQAISTHVRPGNLEQDPFLSLLKEVIETGDRMTLTLVIQIVLEGWGIHHYRKLQTECIEQNLSAELKNVLADEALHHGSGLALFEPSALSGSDRAYCLSALKRLLSMVQIGPAGVAGILTAVLGPIGKHELIAVYEQLGHTPQTSAKLQQLKTLIKAGGAHDIAQELEQEGFFTPHALTDVA